MVISDVYRQLRVPNRKQLEERWKKYLLKNFGLEPQQSSGPPLQAYVNYGRWIFDCPCGNGVLCSPDDKDACCLECGLIHQVSFPTKKTIQDAEQNLKWRPAKNRNWRPDRDESPADLAAENRALGLKDKD